MLEYDIEGVICKANQKLLSLIYMPSDKVLGKTHLELFGKGSKADTSFFAKVSDGNVIELIEKVKIQNKPLELHNTFVPIQSKEGKTLSILNIFSVIF